MKISRFKIYFKNENSFLISKSTQPNTHMSEISRFNKNIQIQLYKPTKIFRFKQKNIMNCNFTTKPTKTSWIAKGGSSSLPCKERETKEEGERRGGGRWCLWSSASYGMGSDEGREREFKTWNEREREEMNTCDGEGRERYFQTIWVK